jgi:hypothetical protein
MAFKAAQPAIFGELAIVFWLMTIGVRPQRVAASAA